jgi:hypothetical protein
MQSESRMSRRNAGPATGPQTCPNCERLQAQVQGLQERVAALEAELRRGKRQAAPFSRDQKKDPPQRPGRKPGQGPFSFRHGPPEAEVEEVSLVPLPACPHCGGAVEAVSTHEHLQVDLPEIRPRWRRFRFQSAYCPSCQRRVAARHPEQLSCAAGAAGVGVGPRAKALACDLKHRLGVPYAKISELYHTAFGLEVTPSALCQAEARLAQKAEPLYSELAISLSEAPAVHVDETGWRIAGEPAWLWVFTNKQATLYAIDRRRSHAVVTDVLSEDFQGVLIRDGLRTYEHRDLAGWTHQTCLAHLIRAAAELEERKRRGAVRFPRAVAALLRAALALASAREALGPSTVRARRRGLEAELDRLISERRHFTDPDNARLARRLRRQRAHLFPFLEHPEVEGTNNRAERMIRPAVISRKTGGCNQSPPGARTHELLASVLVTLRQQGRDILDSLTAVLTAAGEPPPLLCAPTSPSA